MTPEAIVTATGCGVRIAIVDSGVAAHHPHVGGVTGGFGVDLDPDGTPRRSQDYRDRHGHGTACAGVIRWGAPDAELVAVRVLDGDLTAPAEVLARALAELAAERIDVVNLSLGVPDLSHRRDLDRALAPLTDAGTIVVAAVRPDGRPSWPSSHPAVIAVAGDACRQGWEYGEVSGGEAVLSARPWPRPIPGQPEEQNLGGTSFAAPRIAALAARVREIEPGAPGVRVLEALLEAAPRFRPRPRADEEESR